MSYHVKTCPAVAVVQWKLPAVETSMKRPWARCLSPSPTHIFLVYMSLVNNVGAVHKQHWWTAMQQAYHMLDSAALSKVMLLGQLLELLFVITPKCTGQAFLLSCFGIAAHLRAEFSI